LDSYLRALESEPDWKRLLVKLVKVLELSGDTLPFVVEAAMKAAQSLLGGKTSGEITYPAIPYPGGKGRMAPTLVSLMPQSGRRYVEPFAGRGNVFWAAASVRLGFERWVLNDLHTGAFFEAIRTLGNTVEVPEKTQDEYRRQRKAFSSGDLIAILLEPYLTFAGGGYSLGGWGGRKSATAEHYTRTLRNCHRLMASTDVRVTSSDWKKLAWDELGPDDFVYLDPPYLASDVRPYGSANVIHEELVCFLKRAKFKWMLSEYPKDLYLREFGEPFFTENVQLKTANYHKNGGKERRLECLWKNY
jgi:site-specific DNA-adenine methylase